MRSSQGSARRAVAPFKIKPRISLILATVGRVRSVHRFLESVNAQDYQNLEVLIADQNPDDRLSDTLEFFEPKLHIIHIRTPLGLSRSRNEAWQEMTGEIVGFPDDDCIYPRGLLNRIAAEFTRSPEIGGLAGCPVTIRTRERFRGFPSQPVAFTHENVWQLSSSVGLFLRRDTVTAVGDFDETLGLGSGTPWISAEDRDYPLRALDQGISLRYEPSLIIEHPAPEYDNLYQAYGSGAALGRILRKRAVPFREAAKLVLIRPIGGIVTSLLRLRFKAAFFYMQSLRGRISGWRWSEPG
ncbi:MAG: glycosyltransferase family 2 protein [Gemmatimonadaceae bacterium]|nr:glycosyltransferase family 2 protein [Gemmatimonadaceae bacterium]